MNQFGQAYYYKSIILGKQKILILTNEKLKKFKIKVKAKEFESVEFMSAIEKQKIYKNFVS